VHDFFSGAVKLLVLIAAALWFVGNPDQAGELATVGIDLGGRFVAAIVTFVSGVLSGIA